MKELAYLLEAEWNENFTVVFRRKHKKFLTLIENSPQNIREIVEPLNEFFKLCIFFSETHFTNKIILKQNWNKLALNNNIQGNAGNWVQTIMETVNFLFTSAYDNIRRFYIKRRKNITKTKSEISFYLETVTPILQKIVHWYNLLITKSVSVNDLVSAEEFCNQLYQLVNQNQQR